MSEICFFNSPSHSRGRACRAESQHKHFMKTAFPKAFAAVAAEGPIFPKLVWRAFFPKNCCPPHSSLPNVHHPHLLRPLHHLHLLRHLLYIYIYIYIIIIINNNNIIYVYLTYIIFVSLTHLFINLIYMTYIIYNTYRTYMIIYIATSSASPTSSKLSNLT